VEAMMQVKDLTKYFELEGSTEVVRAVDGVDLTVWKGETLGVVGESGCGKTTLGRLLIRLLRPTSGHIDFKGNDITFIEGEELRELRSEMQVVFQDPYSSLNPRMSIHTMLDRPLRIHHPDYSREYRSRRIDELLRHVGLSPDHRNRFPHQFSGGQRQRIAVARALAIEPDFLILDEPTSALDVSVQANILNLFRRLQKDFDLTCVFISHDLSTVQYMSDRIAVMYLGQFVEITPRDRVFTAPLHPYTKALIAAVPIADPTFKKERIRLYGDVPSPVNPPSGCRFHTRCPYVEDICRIEEPKLVRPDIEGIAETQAVACHFTETIWEGKKKPRKLEELEALAASE